MSFEEDSAELRDWVRQLQELGPRVAVATLGEKGSIAYDGERFYECGIVPAEKVVNTVGAGDSYIAGFTKGVLDGLDVSACMHAGAELSSRVIGSFEPY